MCDPVGFLIYTFTLFGLYATALFRNFFLLSLFLFVTVLLSAFRGNAGIDTYLYVDRYTVLESGFIGIQNISIVEPLIPLLMWVSKTLGGSFILFSIIFGVLVSFLYFRIIKTIPNSIYFSLCCFPVIFLDSLFNGLRVGLAYPLIFLAVYYSSIIYFVLGSFSHISALIAAPFQIFSNKKFTIFIFILISSFIIFDSEIYQLIFQRFDSKFNQYQSIFTRNAYSGIADSSLLFVASLIFLRTKGCSGKTFLKAMVPLFIIIALLHFFLISKFVFMLRVTRFIDIIFFAMIAKSNQKIDSLSLNISTIFGFFYILNFLRQISNSCYYDFNNGFLPLTNYLFNL